MDIPAALIEYVRKGEAVLLLGAGASLGARSPDGSAAPSTAELTSQISNRFLGGKFERSPLGQVSEYAISETSIGEVQEFVASIVRPLEPAEFHRLIPRFRWHGLATTNYDRLIEKAYEQDQNALQSVRPIIENGDRLEDYLRDPKNLPLLKLHGCVTRTTNDECPLILTPDQYVEYRRGRDRLFDSLYSWGSDRTIIFAGHSIEDSDLRTLLLELDAKCMNRLRYYVVAPDVDPMAARFWERKKITALSGTFAEFLGALDAQIPSHSRVLAGLVTTDEPLAISERFASRDLTLSPVCRRFLENEAEYVKRIERGPAANPADFYRGMDQGWGGIEQRLDVPRRLCDTIIADVFLPDTSFVGPRLIAIKGHAGSGKSLLMKRIAWDAANDYDSLCIFAKPYASLRVSEIREIVQACRQQVYLFVDDVSDHARDVSNLLKNIGAEGEHLTLVVAERTNEWNVACGELDDFVSSDYEIPYLSQKEISGLLELLEKHQALGTLAKVAPDDRQLAFEQRAGRQLLVALHEATLGKPFEQIIEDEFSSIVPDEAKDLYLTICVLNRLNVSVRAGVISRIHGIPFEYFKAHLFKPLEHVVLAEYNPVVREYEYAARHSHIAEIVFTQVLRSPEVRFDKYIKCLDALNVDYDSDSRAFWGMIRGRTILELFPDHEMALQLFSAASSRVGENGRLLQQKALYELHRPDGNLGRAFELIEQAIIKEPHSASMKHSKAEILLRLVDVARTPLERETRLRECRSILIPLARKKRSSAQEASYTTHSLAKVELKRLEYLLQDDSSAADGTIEAVIKDVEQTISGGLQRLPGDSYLLDAEARLATLLSDSSRAIQAMEKAFSANPRNAYIASRLAKSFVKSGQSEQAVATLRRSLDANQNDRKLHFELARLLMESKGTPGDELEYHFRRSFTEGDQNHEARLLYGRQLYVNGKTQESRDLFRKLGTTRVNHRLRTTPRFPLPGRHTGRVDRLEETYAFIACDPGGDWVYLHRKDCGQLAWENLSPGTRLEFGIAFTFKGTRAVDIAGPDDGSS